ncbi:flagellin [Rhodobacter maris]|uniref:Flagellin n=1 Tax=Rhodobacter maris TaxID=446682 RepID=A0A285SFP5_9RHOB|nr:flagellin [Rhodobacter maris]SOC06714.1 flagellar hook-associated protein 3 FlgL [Rhodobacter maris]
MKYVSVGDMAQTYTMRNHNAQLKTTMTRLSEELVTGVAQDVGAAVGGDFTALASITHSLQRIESYDQAAKEMALSTSTQQTALETIQTHAQSVGSELVAAGTTGVSTSVDATLQDAAYRFSSIVQSLNVSVSGRYLMSGVATDTRPVASADDILAALKAETSGMTTATEIIEAVNDWFDQPEGSGSGFLDEAYFGSTTATSAVAVSETESAQLTVTAADPAIRNMLKGFALAALATDDTLSETARAALASSAGGQIINAENALTTTRANLGSVEELISDAQTRNANQKTALSLAQLDLIGVDEYDTATALEAVETQLETLYTLTSRLSQLSLTDYIR